MLQTASRRIRKAGATVVFVAVALGTTAQGAVAVDEFATPRPTPKSQVPVKTQATLNNRVSEVYVLRAPDVVGQPVGTARATLERSRLRAGRETTQLTSERPAGTVLGQEPKAGTPVQPGAVVNLVIAAPPQREVIVPNLIGQSAEAASAILAKPGLNLGERRRQDSDAPAGTVIAQLPAAGTRVHPGTSVNVTVAVESLVTVPDLIGATPQQAALALRRYQLGLGQQHERESSAPAGTVIRQAPAPGTRVARETRVNVLIATAPVPELPPSRPRPPVVVPPPVVVAPPVIPPIVIQPPVPPVPPIMVAPPAPPVPPIVVAPPAPPEPPVVAVPPAPPALPVAPEPQLPPAPPVAIAPQLPPPPAPPVVTPPPAPPAPAVATAPPAPAPVRKPAPKPQPTPQTRPAPTPAAPVPPAPPVAIAPQLPPPPKPPIVAQPPAPQPAPQPVRETPKRSWPSPIALGLGSVTLLGAAGTVYYRVRTTNLAHATPPNITYAAHWDLGSQQIEADAPLSRGAGLRLQAGFEAVTTTLETDHLVDQSHEMGGTR